MRSASRLLVAGLAVLLLVVACSSDDATDEASGSPSPSVASARLPLGDGRVSSSPKTGELWSCFTPDPNGPGAPGTGPWINADGTWDPSRKPRVRGSFPWPNAMYSATIKGAKRVITGNSLPLHNPTGTFPIPADDPSHEYDQNPNFIRMGPVRFELPVEPAAAAKPSCVGFGAIGILTDGSLLFNAVDARGRDAAAHEILDTCDGHPAPGGIYHHHTVPSCLLAAANGTSTLVGYAFDGFGIYVERDAAGVLPTNTDLDACHGRTSQVMWDGKPSVRYHYVATSTYPYTVGCFHGTPVVRPAPPPPAVGPAPPAVPPASGVPSPSAAR